MRILDSRTSFIVSDRRFPSIDEVLSAKTRDGKTPRDMSQSTKVNELFNSSHFSNSIKASNCEFKLVITNSNEYAVSFVLAKRISDLSLNYVKETMKDPRQKRYSSGGTRNLETLKVFCPESELSLAFADLRSFNDLRYYNTASEIIKVMTKK